jgi:multimeric flavodoxin WrbA
METKRLITAILGSPRRRGNSDTLALEFLNGASDAGCEQRIIIPTDLGLDPCDGNGQCFEAGKCVIRDGMNEIYDTVISSPYLLVATPVYFMGPPGTLKAFIDRFQAVWARSAVLKTFDPDSPRRRAAHRAFAIVTGATEAKRSMYRPTISIVRAFLNVTGFTYAGEMIATGLEKPGDAARREDLLKQAYSSGREFVKRTV